MSCIKSCLDYLGIDLSHPWLYGGTGNAFVLNMNDTVFVDCAQAWDIDTLFDLAPNLGFSVERFRVEHQVALEMPDDEFRQKQREAFHFVRARVDRGLPSYAWELSPIPNYLVITGYYDKVDAGERVDASDRDAAGDAATAGYTYLGWAGWDSSEQRTCPWDKLGTFDVKQIAVHCVHVAEPTSDGETVKAALTSVLDRVERADGWSIDPRYRTGLPAYDMWAEALQTGRANRDGEAYINNVWLECREMAVEFLAEARARLPGRCDVAFDESIAHYGLVRDKLRALVELHPERAEGTDWTTTIASQEGAQLIREAAQAERKAVASLRQIVGAL
jgi:hypothetical protein